jgi:hypothetical protein
MIMSENAIYSIEWKIAGMKATGLPEGVGDRFLHFEIQIDPTDLEGATEEWYAHLEGMWGKDEVDKIRAAAMKWAKRR